MIARGWKTTVKRNYEELDFEEQLHEIRKRTERLLTVRDRSESEMRDRLRQAGFAEPVVERELSLLLAAGLVDDERFTRLYITSKTRSGWGRFRIERELGRFGIDLKKREGYPEEFFCENDEFERATVCLERFRSQAKDRYAAQYRFLVSRGFSNDTVRKALASNRSS